MLVVGGVLLFTVCVAVSELNKEIAGERAREAEHVAPVMLPSSLCGLSFLCK